MKRRDWATLEPGTVVRVQLLDPTDINGSYRMNPHCVTWGEVHAVEGGMLVLNQWRSLHPQQDDADSDVKGVAVPLCTIVKLSVLR